MQNTTPWHPVNHQQVVNQIRKTPQTVLHPEIGDRETISRKALMSTIQPIGNSLTEQEKIHLLKRTLFGVGMDDLKRLEGLTLEESIALLLTRHPVTPPVNDYNDTSEGIEDPDVALGETWVNAKYGEEIEGLRTLSLKAWLVKNMVTQPTSLEEKMILFWHNLLPIQTWDVFFGKLSYTYFQMLREHAFGNFKTLIRALTLDQAMLFYLNGTFNNKEAPDENYARELQELFCIGKGPEAKYTEEDVRAAARVLTGWIVDWDNVQKEGTTQAVFYSALHDDSDKQFSSFYGNKMISGKPGAQGAEELDELMDMIFDNKETALYLCRRLYQFFVYPEINDQAEQEVIAPLAQLLRDSNYEVEPVLKALLSSAHFYDEANMGATIKAPTDFMIGLWKTLEMSGVDSADISLSANQYARLLWTMAAGGMEIGDPPSVSGWPAYYQAPSFDQYWITTDTIALRASSTDSLVYYGFWIKDDIKVELDLVKFVGVLDDPEDPNKMLQNAAKLLLGIALEDLVIDNLKTILLAGQQTDAYWTTAWLLVEQNPDDQNYRMVVENRLKPTFQHLLQLGEAHLM